MRKRRSNSSERFSLHSWPLGDQSCTAATLIAANNNSLLSPRLQPFVALLLCLGDWNLCRAGHRVRSLHSHSISFTYSESNFTRRANETLRAIRYSSGRADACTTYVSIIIALFATFARSSQAIMGVCVCACIRFNKRTIISTAISIVL